MNPVSLFNIASKIETPLMLAALVVLVLFVLFRTKITDGQAKMLFVLALVAIIVGVAADLIRVIKQPEVRYWIDGRVYSPPSERTAGVPRAVVFLEAHEHGVQTTCTDERGYFKFEIPSSSFGKPAEIWVVADKYKPSNVENIQLGPSLPFQEFGIATAPVTTLSGNLAASAIAVKPLPPVASSTTSSQPSSCLEGDWHEQLVGRSDQPNTFQWHITMNGNSFRISRNDQFVHGDFAELNGEWKGDLSWNNGDVWHNVVLRPSADCHTIATNQFWYYKR